MSSNLNKKLSFVPQTKTSNCTKHESNNSTNFASNKNSISIIKQSYFTDNLTKDHIKEITSPIKRKSLFEALEQEKIYLSSDDDEADLDVKNIKKSAKVVNEPIHSDHGDEDEFNKNNKEASFLAQKILLEDSEDDIEETDYFANTIEENFSIPLNKSSPNFCKKNSLNSSNPRFKYLESNSSTEMNKGIKSKTYEMNQYYLPGYNDYFTENMGSFNQQRFSCQSYQGNISRNFSNASNINLNTRKSNTSTISNVSINQTNNCFVNPLTSGRQTHFIPPNMIRYPFNQVVNPVNHSYVPQFIPQYQPDLLYMGYMSSGDNNYNSFQQNMKINQQIPIRNHFPSQFLAGSRPDIKQDQESYLNLRNSQTGYSQTNNLSKENTTVYKKPSNSSNTNSCKSKKSISREDTEKAYSTLKTKIESKSTISLKDYEMNLKGHILALISSKEYSKKMQKSVNLFSEDASEEILSELIPDIMSSVNNIYCNYFYQKYFKYLTLKLRIKLLYFFKNKLFSLCQIKTGVYIVISLIEKASTDEEICLITENLLEKYEDLICHSHGYRALEKLILKLEIKYYDQLANYISKNVVILMKNEYSSEVVKAFVSKPITNQSISSIIISNINENMVEILSDAKGASLVLCLSYNTKMSYKKSLIKHIIKNFNCLVIKDHISVVIESIIDCGGIPIIENILLKIFHDLNNCFKLFLSESFYNNFKKIWFSASVSQRKYIKSMYQQYVASHMSNDINSAWSLIFSEKAY